MTLIGLVSVLFTNLLLISSSLLILVSADYFMSYLSELLLSINEDGIPLAGAFAWGTLASNGLVSVSHRVVAMVDNSEWTSGESARY